MQQFIVKLKNQLPVMAVTSLVTVMFLFHAYGYFQLGLITKLEDFLYDSRLLLTMPEDVDPSIVIVDIDEASLAAVGRWPWGRDKLATLVTQLFDTYGVFLVGFDVIFREADESSGIGLLQRLAREDFADIPEYGQRITALRDSLDYDLLFSESLGKGPVILGYTFVAADENSETIRDGALPTPVIARAEMQGKFIAAQSYAGYGANISRIQSTAIGAGHITPALDEDGIIRRVPMLIEYAGDYYESLSLAIARFVLGVDEVTPQFSSTGMSGREYIESLGLGNFRIPVDANVQALVPYRGRGGNYRHVSAVDVIRGEADAELLAGSIVLVGTSAKGLVDLRPTPVNRELPGVEIHANLISGILEQRIMTLPIDARGIEFLQLLLIGALLTLLLPLLSPVTATVFTMAVLGTVAGLNLYFWSNQLVIALASSLLLILIIYLLCMSYGYFFERRGKRQLSSLFGQYVPPELVEEMSIDPESYTQTAHNREMTVLFTDIRNFTTISEGLTPEELAAMLNAYLTPMTQIIYAHRGTIDKYIGDAVMAFWGAPVADPDHARHALETGLAMLEKLHGLREEFRQRGWPELHIGVGINSGLMSVGDMGSKFRMAYTVLGDAVNLGSRLEGLTKNYGVEIMVGEATRRLVPDYVYRELDIVKVKGKDQPIPIYEPIAPAAQVSDAESHELELNHKALQLYRSQDWDEAGRLFHQLQALAPERSLYCIYLDRINEFRRHPPGRDWDGVYTHTSK